MMYLMNPHYTSEYRICQYHIDTYIYVYTIHIYMYIHTYIYIYIYTHIIHMWHSILQYCIYVHNYVYIYIFTCMHNVCILVMLSFPSNHSSFPLVTPLLGRLCSARLRGFNGGFFQPWSGWYIPWSIWIYVYIYMYICIIYIYIYIYIYTYINIYIYFYMGRYYGKTNGWYIGIYHQI